MNDREQLNIGLVRRYNELVSSIDSMSESEEIKKNIWQVTKLISILMYPLDIGSILQVLNIESYKKNGILSKLRPFLIEKVDSNNELWHNWYDDKFYRIVEEELPILPSEKSQYRGLIINLIEEKSRTGYMFELSRGLIENALFFYPYYFQHISSSSGSKASIFTNVKESYFYRYLYNLSIDDFKHSLLGYLQKLFILALNSGDSSDIIFHYMFYFGYLKYWNYEIHKSKPIYDIISLFEYSTNSKEILKTNFKNNGEMVTFTLDEYKRNNVSSNELQIVLNHAISEIEDTLIDIRSLIDNCEMYSEKWYTVEYRKNNSDNPTDENETTFNIHQNWKTPQLNIKSDDIRSHIDKIETYEIFMDFSKQPLELYHFHQAVDISDLETKPLFLLKEILKKAHEDELSTLDLFVSTIQDKRNISLFSDERKHRNIQQTLSKANGAFGNSIKYWWGKKRYGEYKLILLHEFKYCLIDPIDSSPTNDLGENET